MSFDLFFYLANPARPGGYEPIFAWAAESEHFSLRTTAEGGFTLSYQNRDTGVYFWIRQSHPPPPCPATEGLTPAYLEFNLNLARPRFFAQEAAAVVTDLASRFELWVYDPQLGHVGPPNPSAIFESWCRGNEQAVHGLRAMGQRVTSMDATQAYDLWRYQSALSEVKKRLGEDAFVPQLTLVRWGDTVQRLAILLKPTTYVMPPADLFFVERNGAPHVVRGDYVHQYLGRYCKPARTIPDVALIDEDTLFDDGVMDDWEHFYQTVPVEAPLSHFERVRFDGFVDVN